MPYKHVKYKIPRQHDRRIKLSDADKNNIRALYQSGKTIRSIARHYEKQCSRRLIQMVIFPERLEHAALLFKERRKDGRYYDKEKHAATIKIHRQYKQKLYLQGKLKSQ